MDAVRNEIKTGKLTGGKFHTQKLNEYMNALNKLLKKGGLNQCDTQISNTLLQDILNAINGK